MLAFQQEAQETFRRFFGGGWGPRWASVRESWTPAVEVSSREGDLVMRAELPGIDPDRDVEITATDDVLSIRGERHREHREEGDGYYRSEAMYGRFERQFRLPEGAKIDEIRATYDKGILEVVVPEAAKPSPTKKIPVHVGSVRKALTPRGRRK